MNYETILEVYTLSDILEYNDKTDADCLQYLVEQDFIELPDQLPLDYD